jgi:hypothetical protein
MLPNSSSNLKGEYDMQYVSNTSNYIFCVTLNKTNSKYCALVYANLCIKIVQTFVPILYFSLS